jgi:hypothetical protein
MLAHPTPPGRYRAPALPGFLDRAPALGAVDPDEIG